MRWTAGPDMELEDLTRATSIGIVASAMVSIRRLRRRQVS